MAHWMVDMIKVYSFQRAENGNFYFRISPLQDLTLHKPPMQKERTPNAPCVIYLVGGYSNRQSLDTLECYDVEEHQWTQLSRLPVAR